MIFADDQDLADLIQSRYDEQNAANAELDLGPDRGFAFRVGYVGFFAAAILFGLFVAGVAAHFAWDVLRIGWGVTR